MGYALHQAVGAGHREIGNHLLENGASCDEKGKRGYAPLHIIATEVGDAEMIRLLLLSAADEDALDDQDRAALHLAAAHGHSAAAKALLDAGADTMVRSGGLQLLALHVAAENGHVDVLSDDRARSRRGRSQLQRKHSPSLQQLPRQDGDDRCARRSWGRCTWTG